MVVTPYLVSHEANLNPLAVGVLPDALYPVGDVVQCFGVSNIVHQNDAVRAAVVRLCNLMKSLLAKQTVTKK